MVLSKPGSIDFDLSTLRDVETLVIRLVVTKNGGETILISKRLCFRVNVKLTTLTITGVVAELKTDPCHGFGIPLC